MPSFTLVTCPSPLLPKPFTGVRAAVIARQADLYIGHQLSGDIAGR